MCGIAGILALNGYPMPMEKINRMTAAMHHRGPDDEGVAFFPNNSGSIRLFGGKATPHVVYESPLVYCPNSACNSEAADGAILALGHRRLAIIDPSAAGHQPMSTEDGRYWIVYNGEVYNYRNIRQRLESEGERFDSNSDTEVILKAYRRWGSDCLQQFNGMWAMAIWDHTQQQLFCVRDRIGIKPFYYYLTDDYFIFASEIKSLVASSIYCPEPDWEGVYHAMTFECAPRPMTCFKGIRALEQGHWLRIDTRGRHQKERFWRMPIGEIDYLKTQRQWQEELDDMLHRAVRRRLVADVQVGTFMSGGVDSTTVSALASQVHPGICAFSLGYESSTPELDELPQARATAKMWPISHVVKTIRLDTVISYIDDMIYCSEEPYDSLAPNYLISQLVADHGIKVVLNGLGGDELFFGYSRERYLNAWNNLRVLRNTMKVPDFFYRRFSQRMKRLLQLTQANDIFDVYVAAFSPFSEEDKRRLFKNKTMPNSAAVFKEIYGLENLPFADAIEALCYMDIINYIGNHHVYRVDQFTMRFSVEGRFPLLDHELVELACRMPASMKLRNGTHKFILKKVAEKYIHPTCLKMKKKGFSLPLDHWLKDGLRTTALQALERLGGRGVMERSEIARVTNGFYRGKINYRNIWFLVAVELWLENFHCNGTGSPLQ